MGRRHVVRRGHSREAQVGDRWSRRSVLELRYRERLGSPSVSLMRAVRVAEEPPAEQPLVRFAVEPKP